MFNLMATETITRKQTADKTIYGKQQIRVLSLQCGPAAVVERMKNLARLIVQFGQHFLVHCNLTRISNASDLRLFPSRVLVSVASFSLLLARARFSPSVNCRAAGIDSNQKSAAVSLCA